MKILIIGETGQLGSALAKDSLSLNYEVVSLHRKFDITKHGYMNINYLDLCDFHLAIKFKEILNKINPDVVINTAAYNNTNLAEFNQSEAFVCNCIAVGIMSKKCNEAKIPFITFSTDYVFNGKTFNPYIETDTPNPINIYGLSKLAGEYASLHYENTTVIRTCGLYGLNSTSTKNGRGNFIDNRIIDSKSNKFIQISCDQTVSPTFVNDLSKAVLQLIDHPIKKYNLYHLVNEGYCTWYEFTKEIHEILNIETEVVPINRCGMDGTMKRPQFSALRNERAKELGIMLPHWRDALRRYLEIKYKNGL